MITLYFGSPRSGKSTLLTKFACNFHKKTIFSRYYKYHHCVSNLELDLPRVNYDDFEKLGEYIYPKRTLVLIDEASIIFNNRSYKNFGENKIRYFKKHGHYENDIILFSQAWDDIDITIRRLCDTMFYIHKVGPFTIARKIHRFETIDKETQQIIDGYEFEPLWKFFLFAQPLKIFFRPPYYKYFDSFENSENIPIKRLK